MLPPKMFEFLVGQGFFAAMPSPRLVPLVLGLVAGVAAWPRIW